MTLRTKLLLSQIPLFAVLVFLSALHQWSVSAVGGSAQNILRENYRSVLAAQRMGEAIERMDSSALFLLAGQRDRGAQQAATQRRMFDRELQVEEGNITERGERESTERLRTRWETYGRELDALFAIHDLEDARQVYFARTEPAFRAVKEAVDEILTLNGDAMVRKSDHTRHIAEQLSGLATLAALLALGISVMTALVVTARLLRPLWALRDAAQQLGAGNLDARAVVQGRDELSQLASDFNAMAVQLRRYRESSLGDLLAAQQAAQSAIDSIPDPVLIFDARGAILNLNREAEALLGDALRIHSADPLLGVDPTLRGVLTRMRTHVLLGRGPYAPKDFGDALAVPGTEGARYLLPRATPVHGVSGAVEGATIILQDVTRLRRFDELKNDLVATVAHEFRTPLTSLRMAVHLCLEGIAGPVTDKQAELLHTAREDCERLQGIVDDLLDLARIAAGRVEMRKVLVSVQNLVEGVVAEQGGFAQEHQVHLTCDVAPLAPQKITADPERLGLVLTNLVSNAIRHTPAGGTVTVRVPEATGTAARVEVHDTGVGIAPAHQRDIFLRFFRIPGSPAGGAGLGLSIAKEIVEAHGGTIGVTSQPGAGSTFAFEIPLAA